MNTNLNLYPDKMKNQCINAVSLLSDANEALNSLKFEINEFVNDSYIHSVSFDELKKQCQNYTTVIDAMISCNEADIADFGILESVLDGVHEDLIGEKIDYWEKYYQALINKYNSLLDSGVHSQLQAYFGTLLSTYQELYNMWYAKELLYYEVDGKTSSLFAKSYGRQAISNLLAVLKTSFTLNNGYDSNVIAAQVIKIKNATTGSIQMNVEELAIYDALLKNGMSLQDVRSTLADIKCNKSELLYKVNGLLSSAGYETGINGVYALISEYYSAFDAMYVRLDENQKYLVDGIDRLPNTYSQTKKDSMRYVAIQLLNDGFENEYVIGMMANVYHEGNIGHFENSNYSNNEPLYLCLMDEKFNYRQDFSNRYLQDIGMEKFNDLISKCRAYNESATQGNVEAKFGIGAIQFTETTRAWHMVDCYDEFVKSSYPSTEACARAEATLISRELSGFYPDDDFSKYYNSWKESCGDNGLNNTMDAAKSICMNVIIPSDKVSKSEARANTAKEIYEVIYGQK